jgi:hypothetical protein
MSALLLVSAAGLGIAAYMYSSALPAYESADLNTAKKQRPPGYNPYILNQFQTIRDTIYSASLAENRIETKPSEIKDGVYGISEHHIRLNHCEPITIVSSKINLNK